MKKKPDSRDKNGNKFTKKTYIEYYTPKFDKVGYEERFKLKDSTSSKREIERDRSRSKTPVKVDRPVSPNFSKYSFKSA